MPAFGCAAKPEAAVTMNPNKPTTRSRGSFLPDLLRRPVCRIFLTALLALSQAPAVAAVALAVFNQGSEHQMLITGGTGKTSVTLHHIVHPGCHHHHNGLEHVLLGSGGGDHPDHEFAFGSGEAAEDVKQDPETAAGPASEPALVSSADSAACPALVAAVNHARPRPARRESAAPPLALRRGTVLII